MTSTRSDRLPPVFVEFPNFGYGPAATALALVSGLTDRFAWHVVSTGAAAELARAQLPTAVHHDLDTFNAATWPDFHQIAPPGALVLSHTNPAFAAWAIDNDYRVGVVDTLDWMWPALPDALTRAEFHLVQSYFGAAPRHTDRRELIRPIVDSALWPPAPDTARSEGTLVGFGGMHLPGGERLVADYTTWFLAAALPILLDHARAAPVTIAGGRNDLADLVPKRWRRHPAVTVRTGMGRAAYARAARAARHLVLSPGLASIYECAAARLPVCLQPGFSMSMALQSHAVAATDYPHLAAWPWLAEAVSAVRGRPEPEGVSHIAARITETIHETDPDGETVRKALLDYVDRDTDAALQLPTDPALPDGRTRLAAHLERHR